MIKGGLVLGQHSNLYNLHPGQYLLKIRKEVCLFNLLGFVAVDHLNVLITPVYL